MRQNILLFSAGDRAAVSKAHAAGAHGGREGCDAAHDGARDRQCKRSCRAQPQVASLAIAEWHCMKGVVNSTPGVVPSRMQLYGLVQHLASKAVFTEKPSAYLHQVRSEYYIRILHRLFLTLAGASLARPPLQGRREMSWFQWRPWVKHTTAWPTMAGLAAPSRLVLRELAHLLTYAPPTAHGLDLARILPSCHLSMLVILSCLTRNLQGL